MRRIAPCACIFDPLGPLGILSNFAYTPFISDGEMWQTVEHYYQAQKFRRRSDRERIRSTFYATEAKKLAWSALSARVRPDWDDVRLSIMQDAMSAKFSQNSAAQRALALTWPMPLIEKSPVDGFWGVGSSGEGANSMGLLLEHFRANLCKMPPTPLKARPAHENWTNLSQVEWHRADFANYDTTPTSLNEFIFSGFRDYSIDDAFLTALAKANLLQYINVASVRQGLPLVGVMQSERGGTLERRVVQKIFQLRADVFERKYLHDTWYQDARSGVNNWVDAFLGVLFRVSRLTGRDFGNVLVIGAGSGIETAQVWRLFHDRVTLTDISRKMVKNCQAEAPNAKALVCPAENASKLGRGYFDIYCSLRTYQSFFFDIRQALEEAWLALKPNGCVLISVSNGYLTKDGAVIRGQIVRDGLVDPLAAWRKLSEIATLADDVGFDAFDFADLESEICFIARKPPM